MNPPKSFSPQVRYDDMAVHRVPQEPTVNPSLQILHTGNNNVKAGEGKNCSRSHEETKWKTTRRISGVSPPESNLGEGTKGNKHEECT